MAVTASLFRKHLFGVLEQASLGENVEIIYKGVTFKIVPTSPAVSKLARAKERPGLLVPPEDLVQTNSNELKEWEAEWEMRAPLMPVKAAWAMARRKVRNFVR